jgi:hypothetical protein
MVVTKSELANRILEEYKDLPYTTILKAYKGKAAVDGIKKLFFDKDTKKATQWASAWTPYEKSQAILILDESRLPKRKYRPVLSYQFIIGNVKTGSSLGGYWATQEEGRKVLKELKLL